MVGIDVIVFELYKENEMPVNGATNDEGGYKKMSYMVKRSQGKSSFGATNFKKRVFVLTDTKLTYYDGTMEVIFNMLYNSSNLFSN